MTTIDHPLDALVEEMLPAATELAVCVRDRDAEAVHKVLGPVLDAGDRDRTAALVIALAIMVPDDVTFGDLISWTHQDQLPLGELVLDPVEKFCGKCQQVKHRSRFAMDRSRKDGLFTRCRACVSEEDQQRKERRRARLEAPSRGEGVA